MLMQYHFQGLVNFGKPPFNGAIPLTTLQEGELSVPTFHRVRPQAFLRSQAIGVCKDPRPVGL